MSKKHRPPNGIVYSTDPGFQPQPDEPEHEEALPPKKQLLFVRLDARHRGGKTVTLVEGYAGSEEDLEKLGKKLKTFCGTGGSVKDKQIIIQGDQRVKIAQWLTKEGYRHKSL